MHVQYVLCTLPSRQVVEKNAMFLVSSGFSLVHSGLLVCASDSPVKDELSTWHTKNLSFIIRAK